MGIGFGQLQTAAIVLAVVIITLQITKGTAYAAEKIEDITGVGIGTPRLSSFAVEPAEDGNMQFRFTVPGDKKGAELLIYRGYEPYPDKEPGTPQFDSSNLVYHAVSDRDTTGEKLVDVLEKTKVATVSCPSGYESDGCKEVGKSEFKPGWYKFFAVLKKDRKVVDAKDAKVGFYTEGYVELLDRTVEGCVDGFGNCNVVMCKKLMINYNLEGGAVGGFVTWLGLRKNLVVDVSEDFNAKPRSAGCGSVKLEAVNYFKVDSCTKEEIHELNKLVGRIRLLEAANVFDGVGSEDQYANYIDRLDLWKKEAVRNTLACTQPLGRVINTDPKGAYSEFTKLGWQPVGEFTYGKEVANELDRVLQEEVKPAIVGLRADAFEGYKIALTWNLAKTPDGLVFGEKKVKEGSYKISHFRTRWAGAITTENKKTERPKSPYSIKAEGSGGSIVTSFATDAGERTGKHEFEVRVVDSKGGELAIAKATTGMFDDAYIETYKGGVEGGCVTKGLGKDPTGLHECNVYAQKREEMKALRTPAGKEKRDKVFAAMAKAGISAKCKYEATGVSLHYWLSEECTSEEVDRVWKNYLIEIGRADDYDCVLPLNSEATNVCKVKRQTVNTLLSRDWKDLRVNKGWETNV